MKKHTVHLYSDPKNVTTKGIASIANIYWKVDFNRDLDGYLNKRKYKHDYRLFKTGVGKLSITFIKDGDYPLKDQLAYLEVLAAKHIVSNSGLNCFGFTDDRITIRRDQLHIKFSKESAVKLLVRENVDNDFLSERGRLSGRSSPAAGYLYGATAEYCSKQAWAKPYNDNEVTFDHFNSIYDTDIRENDYIFTAQGEMIIDYRSIEEYMKSDWNQFLMQIKGQEFSRPFDTFAEIVRTAREIIYKDNGYLTKIRNLFGDDCLLLYNKEHAAYLPIKPMEKRGVYLVLGIRRMYSQLKLQEMHEHEFALHIKSTLSKEEAIAAKKLKQDFINR